MTCDGPRDAGLAALWTVWATGVVLSVTVATLAWAGAVQGRQRAENAADLAALAGARAERSGGDGCERAARVSQANGARLIRCEPVAGSLVMVVVEVASASRLLRGLDVPPARARARAGVPP